MTLQKGQITKVALKLLDKQGLEGVSLRKLATKLRVKAPSLYWHFKSKEELLVSMAEAILVTEFADLKPRGGKETWQAWFTNMMVRLRQTMLSHKDGARIISNAHGSPTMMRLTEISLRSLHDGGMLLKDARIVVMAALHYVSGYTIAEQDAPSPALRKKFDMEKFKQEYPTFAKAVTKYYGSGKNADDNFKDGLKIIIR